MPNNTLLRGLPNIFFAVQKDGLDEERHFKNTILSNSLSGILRPLGARIMPLDSCTTRQSRVFYRVLQYSTDTGSR